MTHAEATPAEGPAAGAWLGWSRLGIGLAQGLAAWLLLRTPERIDAYAFGALVLVVGYVPLVLLAGLGRMRPTTLALWALAACVLLAALGVYDHWRDPITVGNPDTPRMGPSYQAGLFGAIALYVLHHLIEPADETRRFPPPYPALFEGASRHAFQLVLAVAFTAAFWAVLELGAGLFELIGIKGLRENILHKTWFACPATALAFAAGVHLTDVRPSMILGVRTVALTLFAWLLPLTAALALAFLAALPFTGLERLWGTRFAGQMLLWASAGLILLTNAAYQDGRGSETLPSVLRYAGRAAGLLLVPMVALAAWATWARVAQYGLTSERVVSLAVVAVGALYALGYAWAALSRGPWMQPLERVNVWAALLTVGLIALMLSPVADPARLSVASQTARLKAGAVKAQAFDYAFLRFRSARFGREALAKLAASTDAAVSEPAKRAQKLTSRYSADAITNNGEAPFSHAKVYPAGALLPETFKSQAWTRDNALREDCFFGGAVCTLYLRDIDGDGRPEVLVVGQFGRLIVFQEGADGVWAPVGAYDHANCEGVSAALQAGEGTPVKQRLPDLQVGPQRLNFTGAGDCAPTKPTPEVKPAPVAPSTPVLSPAFAKP